MPPDPDGVRHPYFYAPHSALPENPPTSLPRNFLPNDPRERTGSTYTCEVTGVTVSLYDQRIAIDYVDQHWWFECPECGQDHRGELAPRVLSKQLPKSRTIDITLDIDLGEIIEGQHVVIRGIETAKRHGAVIHNDFVPGFPMKRGELDAGWGLGEISDDVGTVYDHMGAGGWGPDDEGIVRWGDEDLGNTIPPAANVLFVAVHRASSWNPPESWIRKFKLDLRSHEVSIIEYGH